MTFHGWMLPDLSPLQDDFLPPTPAWYPYSTALNDALPGLPDFINLRRLMVWSQITLTGMRRLHEAVLKRRRNGSFQWWPEARPAESDLAYLLAMSLVQEGSLLELSQIHRRVNRPIYMQAASLLEIMARSIGDGSISEARAAPAILLSYLEHGVGFANALLLDMIDWHPGWRSSPAARELFEWLLQHAPQDISGTAEAFVFVEPRHPAAVTTAVKATEATAPAAQPLVVPSVPVDVPSVPVDVPLTTVLSEERLPGVMEAAKALFSVSSGIAAAQREIARLATKQAAELSRLDFRPLVVHVRTALSAVRRRERLLAGSVEITEQVAALSARLKPLHEECCLSLPQGRWELPRAEAGRILGAMLDLEPKIVEAECFVANLEHMLAKLAVKKGKSRDSLARRAEQAMMERDNVLVDLHVAVDLVGAEMTRIGHACRHPVVEPRVDVEAQLRAELAEARAAEADVRTLLDVSEQERADAEADRDDAWSRIATLQSVIDSMRSGVAAPPVETTLETLDELLEWAATQLGSHVVVLPKAMRETRKAKTVNVIRLYEALLFLRDFYVPMRCGSIDQESYHTQLRKMRFDEHASFAEAGSASYFAGYTVDWRGRRVVLDRHVKWGIGTELQNMIRVYFHWDEETATVVVGHMPTHLDNWKTS